MGRRRRRRRQRLYHCRWSRKVAESESAPRLVPISSRVQDPLLLRASSHGRRQQYWPTSAACGRALSATGGNLFNNPHSTAPYFRCVWRCFGTSGEIVFFVPEFSVHTRRVSVAPVLDRKTSQNRKRRSWPGGQRQEAMWLHQTPFTTPSVTLSSRLYKSGSSCGPGALGPQVTNSVASHFADCTNVRQSLRHEIST